MKTKRILIIDTSDKFTAWLKDALAVLSVPCDSATTVEEAEDGNLLRQADIVLLNVETVSSDRGCILHVNRLKQKIGLCVIGMVSMHTDEYADLIGVSLKHGSPLVRAGADGVVIKELLTKETLIKEVMVAVSRSAAMTDQLIDSLYAVKKSYQEMANFLRSFDLDDE